MNCLISEKLPLIRSNLCLRTSIPKTWAVLTKHFHIKSQSLMFLPILICLNLCLLYCNTSFSSSTNLFQILSLNFWLADDKENRDFETRASKMCSCSSNTILETNFCHEQKYEHLLPTRSKRNANTFPLLEYLTEVSNVLLSFLSSASQYPFPHVYITTCNGSWKILLLLLHETTPLAELRQCVVVSIPITLIRIWTGVDSALVVHNRWKWILTTRNSFPKNQQL